MADLGTAVRVDEEAQNRSAYLGTIGKEVAKTEEGSHWTVPLQEQHPEVERFKLMNLSATPQTMARYLANEGFQAKHRGGWNFSIKKPDEDQWRVIDPDTWTDMLPLVGGDWSDILGDVVSGIGAGVGATLAAGTSIPTGPGAIAAGAAGGAGGATVVEAGKQGLAKLVGLDPTLGEAASRVGEEALYGAGGELLAAAARPVVKAGGRALFGDAAEVAERNAAREAKFLQDIKTGNVPAPTFEQPTEGLIPKLRRKVQKGKDIVALEQEGGQTLKDLYTKDFPSISKTEVEDLINEGYRKVKDIPSDVDEAFSAAQKSATKAASAVNRAEKALEKQKERLGDWTQKVKDAEAKVNRQRAKAKRAKTKAKREELQDAVPEMEKALRRARRFRDKTKTSVNDAKAKVKTAQEAAADAAADAASKEPTSEATTQLEYLRRIARDMDVETIGRNADAILDDITKSLNTKPEKIRRVAEHLGIEGAQSKSPQEILFELFGRQSERVRGALSRQVSAEIDKLGPTDPFDVVFARRGPKYVDSQKVADIGDLRKMRAQKVMDFDPAVYRQAAADLAGKSLDEAKAVLRNEGWTGDLDAYTLPDLEKALYWRRLAGITGEGSAIGDPRKHDLIGADTGRAPTGEEFAGAVVDRDLAAQGEEQPFRHFGAPETVRLRIGGQEVPLGRGALSTPRQRALLRAAAGLRTKVKRGVGGTLERAGSALEAPSRLLKKGLEGLAERFKYRGAELAAKRDALKESTESLKAIADSMRQYTHPALREAGERASRDLNRTNLRATEVNSIRGSLRAAVKAAQGDKRWKGPADVLNDMLKNVDEVEVPKPPEGVAGPVGTAAVAPEAVAFGTAVGAPTGFLGGAAAPLAAAGVASLAGKSLRSVGLWVLRDRSGRNLASLAAKAPPAVSRQIDQALKILRIRGYAAFRAKWHAMLFSADVRQYLREVTGEGKDEE